MTPRIEVGDRVAVHVHAAQKTLLRCGEVLYVPTATGDMWGFRDLIGEGELWTSEPITIERQMQSR